MPNPINQYDFNFLDSQYLIETTGDGKFKSVLRKWTDPSKQKELAVTEKDINYFTQLEVWVRFSWAYADDDELFEGRAIPETEGSATYRQRHRIRKEYRRLYEAWIAAGETKRDYLDGAMAELSAFPIGERLYNARNGDFLGEITGFYRPYRDNVLVDAPEPVHFIVRKENGNETRLPGQYKTLSFRQALGKGLIDENGVKRVRTDLVPFVN